MRSILIAVIACVSLGLISAVIPPNVVDTDLNEINGLSQQIKSVTPAIVQRFTETTCQIITQCCPQIQSTFAQSVLQGQAQNIMEQCFGGKNSPQTTQRMQACAPMNQLRTLMQDQQFQRLARVGQKMSQNSQNKALIASTCSVDELQAIACGSNNVQLENGCQRKVLQRLAQEGDAGYQTQVQQIKANLNQVLGELRNVH